MLTSSSERRTQAGFVEAVDRRRVEGRYVGVPFRFLFVPGGWVKSWKLYDP